MLAATHAITGAIIASQVSHPAGALTLAFISHPILDFVPHWDFNSRCTKRSHLHTFIYSAVDAGLGIIIGFILFYPIVSWQLLLVTMLVALWPDFIEAPYHFGYKKPPSSTIKRLQHKWHHKLNLPWGLLPQVLLWLLAIYLSLST